MELGSFMQVNNKPVSPNCERCESRMKSVFCNLPLADLSILNDNKGCSSYKKGQSIFSEGALPLGLFCVNAGKIKVSQIGEEGREQIVRLAKAGDILGYRALIGGGRYSSSATALDDSSICFIPKSVFFSILDNNNSLSLQIMKLLSHDLDQAEHKITNLAQKPVRERVAEALLFLKEVYGFEADGQTLNVTLTREEIANIVGTATETLIRFLSEFKGDNLIELNSKKIKLTNVNGLVKTANIYD